MGTLTVQSQAIANANSIISLSGQLLDLYYQIVTLNNAWNDDTSLTTLQNFSTCTTALDGSLGTADATTNTTHPININLYTAMNRAVSVTQLANALTQLNNIASFINGNSLATTAGVRSVLNQVTGG